MDYIVNIYNNAPHKTLSKYAGLLVSPNDVDDNDELEEFIVRRIHQENIITMTEPGFNLHVGLPVSVYNVRSSFAKRRNDKEPGKWTVSGRVGALFELENENGEKQIKSRYQINPGA